MNGTSIYRTKHGTIRVLSPQNGIRTIAIPERLCNTLREYKEHQDRHASFLGNAWQNLGYIFTEEDGYVMNPHTPTKQFSKFLKRHNIRHLKFHGLRHTSATMLLANGCDIKKRIGTPWSLRYRNNQYLRSRPAECRQKSSQHF